MAGSASGAGFQWGNKLAKTESSYESMWYNGVWYHVHDCVFCRSGLDNPFVGKLMRLFEEDEGVRKVRIRWFFRPYELPYVVRKGLSPEIFDSKELYIAVGGVKGVENENVVEVICGMAKVLCKAQYGKNVLPSSIQVEEADYFFNRAYDVKVGELVKMASIKNRDLAQMFINKVEWLTKVENVAVSTIEASSIRECSSSLTMMGTLSKITKRILSRTPSMDSCTLQDKKLKGSKMSVDNCSQGEAFEVWEL